MMSKSPIDAYLDTIEWRELPPNEVDKSDVLPYATHEGVLTAGDSQLRVYQLNTGDRIIDKDDMDKFFFGLFGCKHQKVSE